MPLSTGTNGFLGGIEKFLLCSHWADQSYSVSTWHMPCVWCLLSTEQGVTGCWAMWLVSTIQWIDDRWHWALSWELLLVNIRCKIRFKVQKTPNLSWLILLEGKRFLFITRRGNAQRDERYKSGPFSQNRVFYQKLSKFYRIQLTIKYNDIFKGQLKNIISKYFLYFDISLSHKNRLSWKFKLSIEGRL